MEVGGWEEVCGKPVLGGGRKREAERGGGGGWEACVVAVCAAGRGRGTSQLGLPRLACPWPGSSVFPNRFAGLGGPWGGLGMGRDKVKQGSEEQAGTWCKEERRREEN